MKDARPLWLWSLWMEKWFFLRDQSLLHLKWRLVLLVQCKVLCKSNANEFHQLSFFPHTKFRKSFTFTFTCEVEVSVDLYYKVCKFHVFQKDSILKMLLTYFRQLTNEDVIDLFKLIFKIAGLSTYHLCSCISSVFQLNFFNPIQPSCSIRIILVLI